MPKLRCPKFGCNGIGLPAGTRRAFGKSRATIGDTPAYLSGGSSSNRLFTAFGYRGHKVLTFECQKCGRTWQQRI